MIELLKRLSETWGPSGYEHRVRRVIEAEIEGLADDVRVDPLGNLIARVGSGGPKLMIVAHMDEIGVMATFAEKSSGMLRFAEIGGLNHHTLWGQRVQFEDGTLGVIGQHDARTLKDPKLNDLYIDTGGAEVAIGQPAVFWREFAAQGDSVISKALDDRVGCAVAIEAMRRLNRQTPNEVYFVFSVQEEVGLRGAGTAAHSIEPSVALALDVTASGDVPKGPKMAVKMGQGAAVKVHDPGLIVPRAVIDWIAQRADADGIPYQMELLPGGSTDAARVQLTRAGVPSGAISIPTRYTHSPSEMAHLRDIHACVDLVAGLAGNLVAL